MLTVTILLFTTLAMKGGAYIYYFENYVSKNSLSDFISPILEFLSTLGIDFLAMILFTLDLVFLMLGGLYL